jgi:hypothetical protein
MPFAVICLDRPGSAGLRAATRLAHLEYINPHRAKMRIGGALLDDDGTSRVGMVLAIDLPTRDAVQSFMRDEPYNRAGIFESVLIRPIAIVYPEADPAIFDNMLVDERRKAGA